ncbi:LysR family transcriptional regulator [Lacrimispora sp.]|uniref:LysR family transcriptional regulator n=1 Tax=Lacrimispora sp. TaxID=2719234 RepID=UPI00345F74F0
MDNLDWKILTVLYETKSITKAAEMLYMSQSSLTKRLMSMEKEWETDIVRRSSKGVIFTEQGKYLVGRARIVLDIINETKVHFNSEVLEKELLAIGVPNSYARLHFPKLLKAYMKEYNQLQFQTVPNSSDVIMKQLIDGTIDIGIICGDYHFVGEHIVLFHEDLYVVAPHGITLDEIEQLPLIESYFNPMVKSTVEQWWKQYFGSLPHEAHKFPYADIAIEMVEHGLGITFLFGDRWSCNQDKVQMIPILDREGVPISRNVSMMISDRCFKSVAISDFVTFTENFYQIN